MYEPDATTFVVARDGTRLATDIYLPRRPGRVPAVVARTPYGKASNVVWFPAIGRLFADNGMAFVAQDTRGRYASEGELAPFVEASDGWDTLEWITRQPWSDGSSAVFGESYVGFTAIAAAATAHPSLRAAALRNTGTDVEGDWLRHQGVLRLEFVIRWALAAWSGKDNLAPEFDWTQRPPAQIVEALSPIVGRERLPAVLDSWATGGRPVDMPRHEAQFPSLIDRVRVPTHLTTGWWDLFVRGATQDWARLSSRPGVDSRLVAEPTDHAGHDWGDGPTPDPLADFDALAARMPSRPRERARLPAQAPARCRRRRVGGLVDADPRRRAAVTELAATGCRADDPAPRRWWSRPARPGRWRAVLATGSCPGRCDVAARPG